VDGANLSDVKADGGFKLTITNTAKAKAVNRIDEILGIEVFIL
jgi:hypothetical protein